MNIDVREIPEGGLHLSGEVERDIFQLGEERTRPDGPLRYDLHASIVSGSLLVQGSVTASFKVDCVRCMDEMSLQVHLDDCVFHIPLEGDETIDLTEPVREDILLALPVYPHCEEGTPPKECRLAGQFEEPDDLGEESRDERPGGQGTWSILEGFEPSS